MRQTSGGNGIINVANTVTTCSSRFGVCVHVQECMFCMWVLQMGQATGYRTQAHADLTPKRSLLPPLYASMLVHVCVFAVGNRGIVIDRRPVASHTLQHFHQARILGRNEIRQFKGKCIKQYLLHAWLLYCLKLLQQFKVNFFN